MCDRGHPDYPVEAATVFLGLKVLLFYHQTCSFHFLWEVFLSAQQQICSLCVEQVCLTVDT